MDWSLVLVLLAVGGAAFVKGFVGFGFPLIAVPVVALIVDPRTAVIAVSIPAILSNVLVLVQTGVPWAPLRRALPFLVPLTLSAALGASLLPRLDPRVLQVAIGATALAFSLLGFARLQLRLEPAQERVASPVFGVICGVLGGATSIYGPLVALYFQALGYEKWPFVYVISVVFLVGTLAQNVTYTVLQLYTGEAISYGLLACVPMLVGVHLGLRAHRRASNRLFYYAVLAVVLASSVNLIVRSMS